MCNKELFDRVHALNLPLGEFVIFGSGPLGIRDIKEVHDVDILVTTPLYEQFKAVPKWTEKLCNGDRYLDNGNGVELWTNWKSGAWNTEELIRDAEMLEGLPFVRLEHVAKWKQLSGRPKDLEDLARITRWQEAHNKTP